MRKLTALLISVLVVLSMSACSSQKNTDQVSDNQLMSEEFISPDINDSEITDDTSTDKTAPSKATENSSGVTSAPGMENNISDSKNNKPVVPHLLQHNLPTHSLLPNPISLLLNHPLLNHLLR